MDKPGTHGACLATLGDVGSAQHANGVATGIRLERRFGALGDFSQERSVNHDGDGWLIIDDLVDTGKTAKAVRELLPKAHFATVYAKPAGRPLVDSFITEVSQDTWILFPWDSEYQSVQPIIGMKQGPA